MAITVVPAARQDNTALNVLLQMHSIKSRREMAEKEQKRLEAVGKALGEYRSAQVSLAREQLTEMKERNDDVARHQQQMMDVAQQNAETNARRADTTKNLAMLNAMKSQWQIGWEAVKPGDIETDEMYGLRHSVDALVGRLAGVPSDETMLKQANWMPMRKPEEEISEADKTMMMMQYGLPRLSEASPGQTGDFVKAIMSGKDVPELKYQPEAPDEDFTDEQKAQHKAIQSMLTGGTLDVGEFIRGSESISGGTGIPKDLVQKEPAAQPMSTLMFETTARLMRNTGADDESIMNFAARQMTLLEPGKEYQAINIGDRLRDLYEDKWAPLEYEDALKLAETRPDVEKQLSKYAKHSKDKGKDEDKPKSETDISSGGFEF